MPLYEVARKMR